MRRRLVIELEAGSPPSGLVIAPDGSELAFSGWTELAQALEPEPDDPGEAAAGTRDCE